MKIPFNKPYLTGRELQYISESLASGQTAGNGPFTKKCHELLISDYGFARPFLTSSCTDALEMSAMLIGIKPGDEIIVPAYTFVSTALAFARQGAKIVFADSRNDNPCIDENKLEKLINKKTVAIVPVHYGGIACEMDKIMDFASNHKLYVVEDAAHAFGSKYKGRLLGTIGHLGCFSFHETKVVHCGEGGLLSVNDNDLGGRAEIIWEKGTNRSSFHRDEVQKYEWLDTGSSFLMSDISAAFLLSQIEENQAIIGHRKKQWELYYNSLKKISNPEFLSLPEYPVSSEINYSIFYVVLKDKLIARELRIFLISQGIQALTHYLDLSQSPYILKTQGDKSSAKNVNSLAYQERLIRLPLFYELSENDIIRITDTIKSFFKNG